MCKSDRIFKFGLDLQIIHSSLIHPWIIPSHILNINSHTHHVLIQAGSTSCTSMHTYTYMYTHSIVRKHNMHNYVSTQLQTCTHIHTYKHTCIHTHTHTHTHTDTHCVSVCVYVCGFVCVCVCVCVCVHIVMCLFMSAQFCHCC